jgi:hypothetical protein
MSDDAEIRSQEIIDRLRREGHVVLGVFESRDEAMSVAELFANVEQALQKGNDDTD